MDLNALLSAALQSAVEQATAPLVQRITTLEADITTLQESKGMTAAAFVTYLDQQEWFWEKLSRFAGTAAESAVQDHLDEFDHNDYDSHLGDDDRHKDGDDDLTEAVKEALADCTVSLRVR